MRILVDTVASPAILEALLEGLTAANSRLVEVLGLPPLYASGVRYAREPRGAERWQLAPVTLRLGRGDCEDLATWRAGELRASGRDAWARVVRTGPRQLHVVVELASGDIEDPSRVLGM